MNTRNRARPVTIKLLELVEQGAINKDALINSCLNYMSEADVADMAHCEGYVECPEDEEQEDEKQGDDTPDEDSDGYRQGDIDG